MTGVFACHTLIMCGLSSSALQRRDSTERYDRSERRTSWVPLPQEMLSDRKKAITQASVVLLLQEVLKLSCKLYFFLHFPVSSPKNPCEITTCSIKINKCIFRYQCSLFLIAYFINYYNILELLSI